MARSKYNMISLHPPSFHIYDGWASRPATVFVPKRTFNFYPLLSRTEGCQKTKTDDFENQDHNTKKLNCSGCHILSAAGEGGDGDQLLTTRKGRVGGGGVRTGQLTTKLYPPCPFSRGSSYESCIYFNNSNVSEPDTKLTSTFFVFRCILKIQIVGLRETNKTISFSKVTKKHHTR